MISNNASIKSNYEFISTLKLFLLLICVGILLIGLTIDCNQVNASNVDKIKKKLMKNNKYQIHKKRIEDLRDLDNVKENISKFGKNGEKVLKRKKNKNSNKDSKNVGNSKSSLKFKDTNNIEIEEIDKNLKNKDHNKNDYIISHNKDRKVVTKSNYKKKNDLNTKKTSSKNKNNDNHHHHNSLKSKKNNDNKMDEINSDYHDALINNKMSVTIHPKENTVRFGDKNARGIARTMDSNLKDNFNSFESNHNKNEINSKLIKERYSSGEDHPNGVGSVISLMEQVIEMNQNDESALRSVKDFRDLINYKDEICRNTLNRVKKGESIIDKYVKSKCEESKLNEEVFKKYGNDVIPETHENGLNDQDVDTDSKVERRDYHLERNTDFDRSKYKKVEVCKCSIGGGGFFSGNRGKKNTNFELLSVMSNPAPKDFKFGGDVHVQSLFKSIYSTSDEVMKDMKVKITVSISGIKLLSKYIDISDVRLNKISVSELEEMVGERSIQNRIRKIKKHMMKNDEILEKLQFNVPNERKLTHEDLIQENTQHHNKKLVDEKLNKLAKEKIESENYYKVEMSLFDIPAVKFIMNKKIKLKVEIEKNSEKQGCYFYEYNFTQSNFNSVKNIENTFSISLVEKMEGLIGSAQFM
jgi:hypothetical protein